MLFAPPTLTETELELMAEVDAIRRQLDYALQTPKRWVGALRRSTFARAVQGSNSIEGYNVSVEDAIAAAEGEGPLHEENSETWQAIVGYRNAMTYVLQLAADPHFEHSAGFIRGLHFIIGGHQIQKHPGRWRPGPIFVRNDVRRETVYEGPPAELVPPLMAELIASLNRTDNSPPMVRAAMAHLNLVMIHPFADGNGRMSRILQTLILAREGILSPHFCSIEEFLGRNTPEYYFVLASTGKGSWQPANDTTAWIRFCLKAHFHQATTLLRRTRETAKVWAELEIMVNALQLPERTMLALSDAAFGWRVRNATYRGAAEVSEVVASRDLKQLVDKGLLIAGGEKRGRFYTAAESLRALREKVREPKAVRSESEPRA